MEFRQLRYFVAVVDARSISGAAHLLFVVQSAVSHQLANLEKELGAVLLLRNKAGVIPTEAGLLFYRHAQSLLKGMDLARQEVSSAEKEVRGTVAIGLPNSTAVALAVPLLQAVRSQLPNVALKIFEGLSTVHLDQLAAGKLDLAILFEPQPPRGLLGIPLLTENLYFVSSDPSARAIYARRRSIKLSEACQYPLLLPPASSGIRVLLDRECARANLELDVVADLGGIQTILEAVRLGLGSTVAMAANALAVPAWPNQLVLPITSPKIIRPSGLYQLKYSPLTPAGESVKALIVQVISQLLKRNDWSGAKSLLAPGEIRASQAAGKK